MSKKLFDDAIGEVPPSTVDIDAAIARGRRTALVHRAANPVVATVAAVAVVLGGVAVVLLTDDDHGLGPATSGNDSPCDDLLPTAPPMPERPGVAADRLTGVLTNAVRDRLRPGATLKRSLAATDKDGVEHDPLQLYHVFSELKDYGGGHCQSGEDYFTGAANVRTAEGTGSVYVEVGRSGGANGGAETSTCDDPGVSGDESYCNVVVTSNGDTVEQTTHESGDGVVTHQVHVYRADDTSVLLEAANVYRSGRSPGPPTASTVPLTHEQLTEIALDPGLTLYPR